MGILKPLIVQGDRTVLLDVHAQGAQEARFALIPFSELEKSPEHIHTYRITNLSLWNAAGAGFTAEKIMAVLSSFSRYPLQASILKWMKETIERYGKIKLLPAEDGNYLRLYTDAGHIFKELEALKILKKYLIVDAENENSFLIEVLNRGTVKQLLLKQGWPVKDEVPLRDGEAFNISLRNTTLSGKPFHIRGYQREAAAAFIGDKKAGTGFGTVALPCGAGKTIVGILAMSILQRSTLILTPNISAVYQWKRELLDKTDINEGYIGLYTGESKEIKPVTIATYQVLTWRHDANSEFPHFRIFKERSWGLIIYDEVHLLPAPVFRITAELQVIRRLGLTATLVREDGCEGDVFSLVGPKRYDVPWKDLEEQGWIAKAYCIEVRTELAKDKEIEYAVAAPRTKYRIASENPEKMHAVKRILNKHKDESILVIGQYISQLEAAAKEIDARIITGKNSAAERESIYNSFRKGEIKVLVVSKIANFAIDLPDASVAIQISGTFGSRQEEAQRLGRILRPKERDSYFYTVITRQTVEEEFAEKRQKFLAEQGYEYLIFTDNEI